MSRTYGSMDNSRGNPVNALGATFSHLKGWTSGVRVRYVPGDADQFEVYMTDGSTGTKDILLGVVQATGSGPQWVPRNGL